MAAAVRTFWRVTGCLCVATALFGVQSASALTITPAFDSTITGAGNALAIESTINTAIASLESLYTDPGTIQVVFKTSTSTAYVGQSQTGLYTLGYSSYTGKLSAAAAANPSNSVLSTAIAHLAAGNQPGSGGSVLITSANVRVALGVAGGTPCFDSSGTYHAGCGQAYDGVVTLSTANTLNFTNVAVGGAYAAVGVFEHELNEIMGGGGQGSALNFIAAHDAQGDHSFDADIGVLDPYRYAAGVKNFSMTANASSPYFSVDGGVTSIVAFNQTASGDFADFATANNVQSAACCFGIMPLYNTASPEFAMMESIGYDGSIPEPASLLVFGAGIAGLRAARRRAANSR